MERIAGAVFAVDVPQQEDDFEYYVNASVRGDCLVWPVTAPERNHTVVVLAVGRP
ncbi:MAG: hypothetical protein GVY23_07450 [Spirochaetes bacterium]|nr:hypothetical protein [Spirochaetota bacterium]